MSAHGIAFSLHHGVGVTGEVVAFWQGSVFGARSGL